MVPGSTLIYGSSFSRVTRSPRDSKMAAREAAAMPLPREDTTPPVTNTYLVIVYIHARDDRTGAGNLDYSREPTACFAWKPIFWGLTPCGVRPQRRMLERWGSDPAWG